MTRNMGDVIGSDFRYLRLHADELKMFSITYQ
jgi:hypothetical protein